MTALSEVGSSPVVPPVPVSEAAVWLRTEAEAARVEAAEALKIAQSNQEMADRFRAAAANWKAKSEAMLRGAELIEAQQAEQPAGPRSPGHVIQQCQAMDKGDRCQLHPGHQMPHQSPMGRRWAL